MKKLVFSLLFLSLLAVGCGKSDKKDAESADHEHGMASESLKDLLNDNWTKEIKLDGGKKWKANPETTEGVQTMLRYISETEPKTIEDYRALAIKLNNEKNNVLKLCTMQGASHDNLHIFLKPVIEKIEYLANTDDVGEAAKVVKSIDSNLKAYSDYFE